MRINVDKEWFQTKLNIRELINLATDYGLPCIQHKDILTVVGETQLLIFNTQEKTQCQLIEIY